MNCKHKLELDFMNIIWEIWDKRMTISSDRWNESMLLSSFIKEENDCQNRVGQSRLLLRSQRAVSTCLHSDYKNSSNKDWEQKFCSNQKKIILSGTITDECKITERKKSSWQYWGEQNWAADLSMI